MCNQLKNLCLVTIITFAFVLNGCGSSVNSNTDSMVNTEDTQFGIFKVLENKTTVEMSGEITSNSLNNFNSLLAEYSNVNRIEIIECDGSSDDETNLKLSKLVHSKGIDTHLKDNGLIASGGVDFFLAGIKRTKGTNTKIGVHSWRDDDNVATDFPEGDANHLPYIKYYKDVGFTQENAEDFYYFTINAATADSIYYMSESEIQRYGLISN